MATPPNPKSSLTDPEKLTNNLLSIIEAAKKYQTIIERLEEVESNQNFVTCAVNTLASSVRKLAKQVERQTEVDEAITEHIQNILSLLSSLKVQLQVIHSSTDDDEQPSSTTK